MNVTGQTRPRATLAQPDPITLVRDEVAEALRESGDDRSVILLPDGCGIALVGNDANDVWLLTVQRGKLEVTS